MRGRHRAGSSSLDKFRTERRSAIRRNWLEWASVVALIALMGGLTVFLSGLSQVIAAIALGFMLAIAFVGWTIGGDAGLLPWAWGAVGEQQTEAVLDDLGAEWRVEHDIRNDYGNWDHVVIGPPGIFLVETKRFLSSAARVEGDTLRSGRIRTEGRTIRGAAIGLKRELEAQGIARPYVNAVVAIWGDFPQQTVEVDQVTYLHGPRLVNWLRERPQRQTNVAEVAAAVLRLRLSARETV